ncbi:MAG: hypothetical protein ACR2PR_06610 [Pseudohongiellaceae bacterium]
MARFGIGRAHVESANGVALSRWGFWTPWFTWYLLKIHSHDQWPHNHEGDITSLVLWGEYIEMRHHPDGSITTIGKVAPAINKIPHDIYHTIHVEKPAWSMWFMGKLKNERVSFLVEGEVVDWEYMIYPYR